jgi:sorting nexin-1/2
MDSGSQTYEEDPDTGVEIEVKNPCVAKDGAMSKKYIIYDVEGTDKDGNFKVKRRFKDFDELRTKLVESWPGILIPPLPEKKVQGNTDSEFVLERKGLLDYFIKRCSKLSHIYYSDVMQVFLKSSDEQFKKVGMRTYNRSLAHPSHLLQSRF